MNKFKAFLGRKNIAFSAKRYFIDAMGAMAQGLFCTLLVGTILNTLGTQLHIGFLTESIVTIGKGEGAVAYTIGGLCSAMVGPGMAVAIGRALEAPPLVLFSLIPVGFATNSMGGAGGPLAVLFVTILAAELGKAVSKETKVDILVTPIVTAAGGHRHCRPHCRPHRRGGLRRGPVHHVGHRAAALLHGHHRVRGHRRGPDPSHLLRRHLRGAGPDGPGRRRRRGGVLRPDDRLCGDELPGNRWGGLAAQGLGTSMLQMGNIVRNPRVWIPPPLAAAITGPIATCLFGLEMNGPAVSSGMGTCGLVGQIGVYTGWVSDVAAGLKARHRRHGLAGAGADLLRVAGGADVAVRHASAEVGLDQARRPEAGSVSLSSKRGPAASPQALFTISSKPHPPQIDAGYPLADGAGQLIGDGSRLLRHIVDGVVRPEDLHLVPHVHAGPIRQIDHAHIHADASPLGAGPSRRHHLPPVGQAPEKIRRRSRKAPRPCGWCGP